VQLAHNDSCFVIISDDEDARSRAFHALTAHKGEGKEAQQEEEETVRSEESEGKRTVVVGWVGGGTGQRVMYERNAELLHSGLDHEQMAKSERDVLSGMDSAFADWIVFTQVCVYTQVCVHTGVCTHRCVCTRRCVCTHRCVCTRRCVDLRVKSSVLG